MTRFVCEIIIIILGYALMGLIGANPRKINFSPNIIKINTKLSSCLLKTMLVYAIAIMYKAMTA